MKLKIFSLFVTLLSILTPLKQGDFLQENKENTFGYTTGQFNVSDAGSATYSIPFIVPPGTGGMTPQIGIAYSSQGGNGLMGVGWSLQGISTISRSTHTLAQDEKIKGIKVNSSDTYSMDGERMMPVFGQNGANDTEYRTEQNAFVKIVSYGNVSGSPEKFKVWTKAGLIMEYGFTSDARIEAQNSENILFWVVNKITDTKGNAIQFFYQENNAIGEYYPTRIAYTSNINAGLVPYNSIHFKYSNRPDSTPKFVAGYQMQSTKVLTAVEAYHKNDLARAYRFQYEHGETTGVCRLKSVQECGTDGTCFTPTVFNWKKEAQLNFQNRSGLPANDWKNTEDQLMQGDWDGDGKIDLMRFRAKTGETFFYKNDGKFNFGQANKPTSLDKNKLKDKRLHLVDFNADGFTDIMGYNPINGQQVWYLNNGKGFSQLGFRNTNLATVSNDVLRLTNNEPVFLYFMDWNGDGRTDLMTYHKSTGANNCYFNQSNKQTLRFVHQRSPLNPAQIKGGEGVYPGDWDGDGLADVLWYDKKTGTNRWIINNAQGAATRISFDTPIANKIMPSEIIEGMGLRFGNWNGDGLTDIMWYNKIANKGKWWCNKGNLQFQKKEAKGALTNHLVETKRIHFLDYNGDGADDLMIQQENGHTLWFQNDGQLNFATPLEKPGGISLPYDKEGQPQNQLTVFGGYGETGILDIFQWNKKTGANDFYCTHLTTSNIIDKIVQGNGAAIDIAYRPITNPDVYTKESTAIYPEFDFQTKFFVVCDYQVDNGIGGKSKMTYQYKGAKMDLRGRGFRGFKEVSTTDETTGIITKRIYNRDHQFISSPLLKTTTSLKNGTLINETINQPTIVDYFKNGQKGVQFSHTAESITRNFEINGQLISEIKTTQNMDDFGNVKTMVVDYGNGYQDITKNSYDTQNQFRKQFLLGRLSRSEVTRIAPRQAPVIKVAAFEYDEQSGLLTKEITEPDRPRKERIEKTYEHDAFGNILKSTTTFYNGASMESRSTMTTYDKTGRFLLTTQNDLGHSSTTTYDPILGHPLSETDINGLVATNEYDAFGRLLKTTLPDGNWSAQAYLPCASGDCPDKAIFYLEKTSSANPVVREYYDLLGREIQMTSIGFDGQTIYQKTQFSERGLVTKKSEPHYNNETPNWIQMEYDELGREIKIITPGNQVSETRYEGLKTTFINPKFQKRIIQKNVLDQLVSVRDNEGNKIEYRYSPTGNMTEMIDPKGNVIQLEYDFYGNRIALHDPDMGSYFYAYNSIGELINQIDPKGNKVTLDYDQLGRMIQRTEPEGVTNWLYDTKEMGLGKLASMESADYAYQSELVYDELGRVKRSKETIAGKTYQTSSAYDEKGRLQIMDYPSSFTVRYVYNDQGYLAEVRHANTNQLYWKVDKTNSKGQLIQQSLGNTTQTTFQYDAKNNWLESIQTKNGQTQIQDLNYVYDALGNLVFRHNKAQQVEERFSYDKLNRLIASEVKGQEKITIEYDLLGNITKKSDVGNYFYGENNTGPHQLTKIEGINGTIPCPPSANADFIYTSFNKVQQIEKDSFRQTITYSPNRSRTIQQYYIHDKLVKTKIHIGNLLEVEITDTLTRELYYIRGNGGVIAVHNEQTKGEAYTHYWHKDHLGSVQSVTDQNAAIVQVLSFDAWGKRRNIDGSPIPPKDFTYDRGFTGHEHIDWFDLINMNGRIYDPVIGRFISPDPFIQAPDNLQNWNRYGYVLNNPLNLSDPSGFFWKSIKKRFKKIGKSLNKTFRKVKDFLKKNWKVITIVVVATVVSVVTLGAAAPAMGTLAATMLSGAAAGFVGGTLGTLAAGGNLSDALVAGVKGAIIGAVTAAASYGANILASQASNAIEGTGQIAALARKGINQASKRILQGVKAELSGGKFKHGFLKSPPVPGNATTGALGGDMIKNLLTNAVIGGTAAELGGGKFVNGAVSEASKTAFQQITDGVNITEEGQIAGIDFVLSTDLENISITASNSNAYGDFHGTVNSNVNGKTDFGLHWSKDNNAITTEGQLNSGKVNKWKGNGNLGNSKFDFNYQRGQPFEYNLN